MKKIFLLLISSLLFASCNNDDGNNVTPKTEDDPCAFDISSCAPATSASSLDIMTWNIEHFPKRDDETICRLTHIIDSLDVDIIAVQEIMSTTDFQSLADELDGWEAAYYDVRGDIELGFLMKTSEIMSHTDLQAIYPDSSYEFPREPVLTTITHKSGLEVTLINMHLKCCDNGEHRRGEASVLLKDYIDTELPANNVVVLGDFNDDILSGSPFENFINDSANYEFADQDIAAGSEDDWSYPSWPSHLDHMLITNELTDNVVSVSTVKLDDCVQGYSGYISDHRPVVMSLK